MSQTISFGTVGPGPWTYSALVMANRLQSAEQTGEFDPADVPKGVLYEVTRFFDLLLDSFSEDHPQLMPVSNNVYLIAHDVLTRDQGIAAKSNQEIDATLTRYAVAFRRLREKRRLSGEELEAIKELRLFLRRLHEAGASDRYITSVSADASFPEIRVM